MARAFFKKSVPRTLAYLASGAAVKFNSIDNITGYFATDSDFIANGLRDLASRGVAGVKEILEAEYADFQKKRVNSTPPKQPWREEISSTQVPDTLTPKDSPKPAAPVVTKQQSTPEDTEIELSISPAQEEPVEKPKPRPAINLKRPRIAKNKV